MARRKTRSAGKKSSAPQKSTKLRSSLTLRPPTPTPALVKAQKNLQRATSDEDFLSAYQDVLRQDPTDIDTLLSLGRIHEDQEQFVEAAQTYSRALRLAPNNEDILERFIRVGARARAVWDATCAAKHWVNITQKHPAKAARTLAGLYGVMGAEDLSKHWAFEAARVSPMSPTRTAQETEKLSVLVLGTIASGGCRYRPDTGGLVINEGHNNLPQILDRHHVTLHRLNVDALETHPELLQAIPRTDIVYNGITDPERCRQALKISSDLCKKLESNIGVPVINQPEKVLECTRETNARRGEDWDGVLVPKSLFMGELSGDISEKIRQLASEHDLKEPVILRAAGFQGAKNMHLIDDLASLKVRLQKPTEVYLIDYVDTRAEDQLFWKYRAFLVDDTLYPGSVIASRDWVSNRAAAKNDPQLQEKMHQVQAEYDRDPESVIGKEAWSNLRKALTQIGLEYCGVDFGVASDGTPVIFEANPAMRSILATPKPLPELIPSYTRIADAVNNMFCEKAGISPDGIQYRHKQTSTTSRENGHA